MGSGVCVVMRAGQGATRVLPARPGSSCIWGLEWQMTAATLAFSCSHALTPQCHLRPICARPGAEMWGEQSSPVSCPWDSQAAEGHRL